MIVSHSFLKKTFTLIKASQRTFVYDIKEILRLEHQAKKKMAIMRMFTEMKDFNYQPPQMYYDK